MPELIAPTGQLRASWLEARDEWGPGVHQDGAGLHPDDEVDTAEGFAAWIGRLRRQADHSIPPGEGRVHATYWWVAEHDT